VIDDSCEEQDVYSRGGAVFVKSKRNEEVSIRCSSQTSIEKEKSRAIGSWQVWQMAMLPQKGSILTKVFATGKRI
jgi:hypothetical protein